MRQTSRQGGRHQGRQDKRCHIKADNDLSTLSVIN